MTDWEQRYLEKCTPWDYGEPSPCLVEYLETAQVQGSVLIPGCGAGHDAVPLVKGGARVTALDIAPSAIELGKSLHVMDGLEFVLGDLFNLPPEYRGVFDWVWEHTCYCAIDPSMRAAYVDAVAGVLKPGGRMLAVFYLDPWDDDEIPEPPPFGCELEDVQRLFSLRFEIEKFWNPGRCYKGREGKEKMALLRKKN